MKKSIDQKKLLQDAAAKKISPYLLMKRESHYRKVKEIEIKRKHNCFYCKKSTYVNYRNNSRELQCYWIGIVNDYYAVVDNSHICKYFEKGLYNDPKGDKDGKTI